MRDLLVATFPWPPPGSGLEGAVKGWFDQAEEALQALHGMPSSEAKCYKGRSKGLRTVSGPLEAKVQDNRFERASAVTYIWLSLRHLSKRRWDLGPIGPSGLPGGYRARRAQQLFEAASRLK
eukprot:2268866-Pyramimonas_sp.AAC.1